DRQDAAGRLERSIRGEEEDRLGDVLRSHPLVQERPAPVEFLEFIGADAVRPRALLAHPLGPEPGVAEHRVRVDEVHAHPQPPPPRARTRANWVWAACEALYAAKSSPGASTFLEATNTTLPPIPCSRSRRIAERATRKCPVALTSIERRQSAASRRSIGATCAR